MAQGLFAGETDYRNQSLNDIRKDVDYWRQESQNLKEKFRETIDQLRERNYWDQTVPFDFRGFCNATIKTCDTIYYDFGRVLIAIDNDKITKREIVIMRNIAHVAGERQLQAATTFKTNEGHWQNYEDENFQKTEELYADGRDFFLTLLDAGNAAGRLEDYVKEEPVVDKSIHAENSVVIGDGNRFANSDINVNKEMEDSKSIGKWLMETLWVSILVGLIIWFIPEQVLK